MEIDVVRLTQDLVSIPSLNPMNRETYGEEYLEGRVGDFLLNWACAHDLQAERHPVLPGRDNVLIRLPGRGPSANQLLLLEAHQDTVPTDGMTIDPFAAELRDGRIYGRGACDVKGGMATFLTTVQRLLRSNLPHPTIVVACTVNEENGFDGVRHLKDLWAHGFSPLLPGPPVVAIVAEPTDLHVVSAHKGTVRWRCHTRGRAAHSSDPSQGDNAIYAMGHVTTCLAEYARSAIPSTPTHPLLGPATLSVGTIQGGISVNTVPDECTIEIDRRLLPQESAAAALHHVQDYLRTHLPNLSIEHEPPFLTSLGLHDDLNQSLAAGLAQVIRRHGAPGLIHGVPFGTDAGTIASARVPVVVFGPGSIAQAHTKDEWIAVDALEQAVEILVEFCSTWDFH